MKKHFEDLEEYLQLILKEGRKLAKIIKVSKKLNGLCSLKCASCLAAIARSNVDKEKYDIGFSSREDICMFEARDILAKELNWKVN